MTDRTDKEIARPWPKYLPRFAESFRIMIDHPQYGHRLVTGEWQDSVAWSRAREDFSPQLALAGKVSFIASSTPAGYQGANGRLEWYGDAEFPDLTWWSRGTEWNCIMNDARIAEFAARKGVTPALIAIPMGAEIPWEVRDEMERFRRAAAIGGAETQGARE